MPATKKSSKTTKPKTRKAPAAKKAAAPEVETKKAPAAVSSTAFSQRQNKDAEKLRNLSDSELLHKQSELNDQLFRLKFQMKMGQTESLKKIRDLRRDLARVKTIAHGRTLGLEPTGTEKK